MSWHFNHIAPEDLLPWALALLSPMRVKSIMYAYMGITVGDVASGAISQLLKSRKKKRWPFL